MPELTDAQLDEINAQFSSILHSGRFERHDEPLDEDGARPATCR